MNKQDKINFANATAKNLSTADRLVLINQTDYLTNNREKLTVWYRKFLKETGCKTISYLEFSLEMWKQETVGSN